MAEGPRAAVPALAELHDCVPQRDYARSATQHYDAGEESPLIRWHDAGKASTPYLVACVQVLLARQIDRAEVAVGLRTTEDGFGFGIAAATVCPNRSFARIVSEFSSRPVGDIRDDLYIPGTVVEVRNAMDGDTHARPAPMAADLGFRFERGADGVSVTLAYNRLLYRRGTIASLARQLTHMVSSLSPESQTDSQLVSLLDRHEFHRIVHGFNDNRVRFPSDRTLSDLIEAQAQRTPGDCCVAHGERRMTYAELDTASAKLATLLRSLGVRPGRFVAILDHRGPDFVLAMLAIWKAGGAYVPIDPSYPEERVRYMLEDSESPVALVGSASMRKFARIVAESPGLTDVVCLQAVNPTGAADTNRPRVHGIEEWQQCATTGPSLHAKAKATDPAYMIYTSGSTGRPKGAIVRHDGAVNHLLAQAHSLGTDGIRRFLQTAPSSSDISVWQFAAPLVFGGVTVIVDDVTDVENILTQVRRHGIQVIELVPVVMRFLIDYAANLPAGERALPSLRWAMVTGESASVELVNAWLAVYPHTPVVNAYGPTEAADDVAQAILVEPLPSNQLTVPIGRSLANMDVYVLDDRLYPVPTGAIGEICVAGVGVGNGYWRRPEQTRRCFVPNPFAGAAGATIYRTGDMGRLLDDGTLECLGRRDHQVQLRGFRIELQEIEAVLCAHPAVSIAAAQVFRDGSGDGRLVAYVVFKPGDAPEPPVLRSWLAERLPPAMVPSSLVPLEQLPLNPAGKIDRNALRPPEPPTSAGPLSSVATQGTVASILAALWQQELGVAAVGPDDDFFDLGGDSLSALGIVVGARAAGLRLRPGDILQHPTVARLAQVALPIHRGSGPDAVRRGPASSVRGLTDSECSAFLERESAYEAVYPLTPPQQGIFMHWLLARDKTAYIDQYSFTLTGPLSPTAFEQAWEHVATRHPVLRTAFLRNALSEPAQAVLRRVALDFEFVDHAHLDAAASGQALRQLMADAVQQGFAVARPPLSRVTLVRLATDLHRLVWTHHHVVVDGWSMSIVLSEVLQAHAALSANRAIQLPAAQTYGRYIAWLQQHDTSASEAFWRESLAGFTGAPPFSVAPPQEPGSGYEQIDIELSADIGDLLVRRARSCGVTLTTLLLAAWACLLSRHTGRNDVVFGMVASGRELDLERVNDIVGLFVTTLPLRIDAGRVGDVGDWLRALQRRSAAAREHGDVSLSQILRWSKLEPGRTLLDTLFVMSNYPGIEESARAPLHAELAEFRTVPAYPMSLIVSPGRTLGMRLVYDCRRFETQAVAALAAEYAGLLDGLAQGRDPRNAA